MNVPRSRAAGRTVTRILVGVVALSSIGAASAIHNPSAVSARTLLLRAAAGTHAQAYSGALVTTSTVNPLAQYDRTYSVPAEAFVEGATDQRIFHLRSRHRNSLPTPATTSAQGTERVCRLASLF